MTKENHISLEQLRLAIARRYAILEPIGSGGMGSVYLANDERYSRRVAIKVMHPDVAAAVGPARFLREIDIAARLQHPHILPLFDSGEVDGTLYYVMPFAPGESLRQRIDRERQLPFSDVCRITQQIGAALDYAHAAGVIHRDIKPHNVLLWHGQAILADFGIAKMVAGPADALTFSGITVGTPLYMSPEQAGGDANLDGRSDQYSLGCVVYEMITGETPFAGAAPQAVLMRHMVDSPTPMRVLRPTVPPRLDRAVAIALAKAPADRHASATAFAEALDLAIHAALPGSTSPFDDDSAIDHKTRPINAGRLVSKTCDRWSQMNAVDSILRGHWKRHPGRPHVFVIPGDEGEGHDSLLDRLCGTIIARFAEEIGGSENASVVRVHAPWPDAEDVATASRDLAVSLFREADPRYMGDDLDGGAFVRLVAGSLARVAVIHHDVRVRYWSANTPRLIEWYVTQYWGSAEARRGDPQLLVFLKLIHPAQTSTSFRRIFPIGGSRRQKATRSLDRIPNEPLRCGWTVLNELRSVSADDVKDWLTKNHILDSEHQRDLRVKELFKHSPARRMVELEPLLAEIHQSATTAHPFAR